MKTVTKEVLTFTENDIYVVTYLHDDGSQDDFVIIGEENAHHYFDWACELNIHNAVILYKGKIIKKLNNCVLEDIELRRWKKGEAK